jgi:hypothetical protein
MEANPLFFYEQPFIPIIPTAEPFLMEKPCSFIRILECVRDP